MIENTGNTSLTDTTKSNSIPPQLTSDKTSDNNQENVPDTHHIDFKADVSSSLEIESGSSKSLEDGEMAVNDSEQSIELANSNSGPTENNIEESLPVPNNSTVLSEKEDNTPLSNIDDPVSKSIDMLTISSSEDNSAVAEIEKLESGEMDAVSGDDNKNSDTAETQPSAKEN